MTTEFTVSIGLDTRELLQSFQRAEQDARNSGQAIGRNLSVGLDVTNANIRALQNQIKALTQTRAQLKVDSSEYKSAQGQIDLLQSKLQRALGERQRLQIDTSAITAAASEFGKVGQASRQAGSEASKGLGDPLKDINARIGAILRELGNIKNQKAQLKVDSTEFAQAEARSQDLKAELSRLNAEKTKLRFDTSDATEASDKFRLLDGVIQGVAFSLSNAVIDGAGQAFRAVGNLINNYARLDTEIRKAAAAGGEAGGYGKLSAAIDQVGIEAAGTQQQVAELTTELVRGGLTVDQATKALGGIVRGAEATATSYDRMGQIVTATLTAFGLEASQTTRVVDALVQGANSSATDVSGLGEAFKTSAPAAKLLGISVEGLATAVGLFTNAGITAGEAGTTLRNGLSQLASAAPQTGAGMSKLTGQAKVAAEAMKVLKLDIYNANGTLKPMETVLLQLKGAFDKLRPAAQMKLASDLFGGTDDGTKWLAVLGQSEEKIKAMAAQMANAKGATDRNRDAMQGFQLTMQQLTGTLDSLGNNVGRIAAAALLPLVNAANVAVGAVAALPGPIKDTVIAIGLLAGAATGAAAAMAVFQRVAEMGVAQKAAKEVVALASGIRDNLGAAINAAKAAIPGLVSQLEAIGKVKLDGPDGAIKQIADSLKNGFRSSVEAAKAAFASFAAYLKSADFANFIAGAKSAMSTLGPLALAVAGVSAAIAAYNASTADSRKIAEAAADGQDQLTAALAAAGIKTGELTTLSGPFARAWQNGALSVEGLLAPLRNIPGIGNLVANSLKFMWDGMMLLNPVLKLAIDGFMGLARALKGAIADANATQGLENAAIALNNLQAQSGAAQNAAAKLFAELQRAGGQPNTKQREEIQKLIPALEAAKNQAGVLQQQYTQLAAAARNSGNEKLAKEYERLAAAAGQDIKLSTARINQLTQIGAKTKEQVGLSQEQIQLNQKRAATELEINKVMALRPIDNQLAVGQALLNLTQAIGQAEQSRYAVTRSALGFELQQAQERGASENQINAIKRQIDANDRAALTARYRSLQTEQQLQLAMLNLSQQKARTEANLAVLQQRAELMKAQADLQKAISGGDQIAITAAQAQVNLQEQILGVQQDKVNILAQTQPLERAALGYQQETARNGLKSEAAAKGYQFALNGTLQPANRLVELQGRIGTIGKASAADQQRYAALAERSGIAIGKAADGTVVLGQTQQDVNTAVGEMNRQLTGAKGGYDAAGKSAGQTKTATDGIRQALQSAGVPANQIAGFLGNTETKVKGAKGETDKLKGSLQDSATPASGIASAFVKVGEKAPAAVQGSRDFAGWLSSAKGFAESIAQLDLGGAMRMVASETSRAATAAKEFYGWLNLASGLPGSRWTGGPVEAGGEYKINELGQEAFLSAGRLSLINAAPNSIWRAPSDGVVIPAGITAQLQARAAVEAGGGQVGVAELAVEVGKLRAEVGNLARKDWSVHVQHRTGPTGSQVMRTLLS